MPWTTLTEQMVMDQFTELESAAIAAAQSGGASKLPEILEKTLDQIREDILAGGFELDADTTKIPAGLHNDAISMVRWKLLTSIPGLEDLQTEVRRDEHRESLRKLRDIAAGKRRVEPPAGATNLTSSGTWNSENKIVGRMNPTPRPGLQSGGAGRYANENAPEDAV